MVSTSECEPKKRKSKGKQKIEMKKVEKKESRHVMFSKRRKGLFKKCNDLCSAYDCQYAAIAYSIAGKPFVSGYPSADDVIQRFVRDNSSGVGAGSAGVGVGVGCDWWDSPIDGLGLEELERFKTRLEGLRDGVISRVNQVYCRSDNREVNNASMSNNDEDVPLFSDYYQWMKDNSLLPDLCLPQANWGSRDGDGVLSRVDRFSCSCDNGIIDQFPNYYQSAENTVPELYHEFTGVAY
ncbi:hypothetical protein vseg_019790 [Gypsophila vaccaria]